MDIISKTTVPSKNKGDGLSSNDVNSINGTLNSCVSAINPMLQGYFNINAESGNFSRSYTAQEAISAVPLGRKCIGLTVRYKDENNDFIEITFVGESTEDWDNLDNWVTSKRYIDGGEW